MYGFRSPTRPSFFYSVTSWRKATLEKLERKSHTCAPGSCAERCVLYYCFARFRKTFLSGDCLVRPCIFSALWRTPKNGKWTSKLRRHEEGNLRRKFHEATWCRFQTLQGVNIVVGLGDDGLIIFSSSQSRVCRIDFRFLKISEISDP